MKKYIELEKFDTDSLFYDVENQNQSNILSQTQSAMFRDLLYEYIQFKRGIIHKIISIFVVSSLFAFVLCALLNFMKKVLCSLLYW